MKKLAQKSILCSCSANNLFFTKAYLAIIKSGNICIPLDPYIEQENFAYIKVDQPFDDIPDRRCWKETCL